MCIRDSVYDISHNQVGGSIPTWFAMYREYEYIEVALERNAFACPVPDETRYLYRETACVPAGEDDYVGGSATGRKDPPDDGERGDEENENQDASVAAGIADDRAYSPSSAISAAEPRRSKRFFAFGSLETAAGAGALFAALLALSLGAAPSATRGRFPETETEASHASARRGEASLVSVQTNHARVRASSRHVCLTLRRRGGEHHRHL